MDNRILKISTQTGNIFNEVTDDEKYLYEKFSYLKECGFEAIDYNMDHFLDCPSIYSGELNDFWDKSLDELYEYFSHTKNAIEKSGICFSQAHSSFPLYFEGKDDFNEYMIMVIEKTIAVCGFLGCPAVVAHPISHEDKERETEINLAMYRKMIPAAKKYGVKVCLENTFTTFGGKPTEGSCTDVDEVCRYIDKLNSEACEDVFGFCLDIGHANLMGRSIKRFITTLGSHLTCLHIHDNDGIYDMHMMPYTQTRDRGKQNCTDWDGMIDGLRKINYQGNLSFETFRGVETFPNEVEPEVLRLLSSIGRYFRSRIAER